MPTTKATDPAAMVAHAGMRGRMCGLGSGLRRGLDRLGPCLR